ncbi:xylulokinase [Sphaerotilaceae bacterium SBD11-9]
MNAIGLDLGTSSVKAVLLSERGELLGEASAPLEVSRPHPLWSEQDPDDWLTAADIAMRQLRERAGDAWQHVASLGVAGQMHGATLLDAAGEVLRPCILWNDGRSQAQCVALEAREPDTRRITANPAMAGFTAPKLMWVQQHEPAIHARVAKVLLPKDWLVWQLAGVMSSDCSDASGTLWLDVARRRWSDTMLQATGMRAAQMPELHEGCDAVGSLQPRWAAAWGLPVGVTVAAGAGDNAAGAVGVGVTKPGTGFISLGTSGVVFVATDGPQPNPDRGVHAFCHALPGVWHQMAVMLSASSALSWWCTVNGSSPEALLRTLQPGELRASAPLFLPYLSGERTPHADPGAQAGFIGMTHSTTRDDLSYAVLEGVAFSFADGAAALRETGAMPQRLLAIGGGARSDTWLQLMTDTLGVTLDRPSGAEVGPALGAARLALKARGVHRVDDAPPIARSFTPDPGRATALAERLQRFRAAYRPLRQLIPEETT